MVSLLWKMWMWIVLAMILPTSGALANPFRSEFVCIPKVNPSHSSLEFVIRDDSNCQEGENWFRVYPQKGGVILLYPSGEPLPPEEQKGLEEFKKFHGIER